jgi:ATP-dependent helicase/nuclease subunit B
MPTTVLQAAVGAGKTEAAIQRLMDCLAQTRSSDPFPKAWVLLATKRQEIAFRQRLLEQQTAKKLFFNVEFFNFYELNTRILNITHVPIRRIHEPARLGLVRTIAEQLYEAGELQIFGQIWHTPGFVSMVAQSIYELKQNLIESNVFASKVRTQKDYELAQIYLRYQDVLQAKSLVDREGEGWLAEIATQYPDQEFKKVRLLLVDGYDQFNVVQARVLANLAKHIENVTVTLTTVPQREQTIGKRFEKALSVLQEAHNKVSVSLYVDTDEGDKHRHDNRAHALQGLTNNIFLELKEDQRLNLIDSTLMFIEAPDPAQEVSAVLRRIKRMILDGVSPDDILIAVRDWQQYGASLNDYRRLYQIPMLLHFSLPIAENPSLIALMNVLNLAEGGFERRAVLDVLRSPYVQVPNISLEDVDLLEQASLRAQVLQGRAEWLDAIEQGAEVRHDVESGRDEEALYDHATRDQLHVALMNLFDAITPTPTAYIRQYVFALEHLIGRESLAEEADTQTAPDDNRVVAPTESHYSLNMIRAIRALDSDEADVTVKRLVARDITAMNSLKRIIRGFLHIEALMQSTLNENPEPITWEAFLAELRLSIESASEGNRNPIRNGRVLATTALEARGLPHAHVFILGLSEGIFPKPISEDPLYLDTERGDFFDRGIPLERLADRANDDGIFYELICLPYATLTLSRPTVREGKLWNESHLWRVTQAVFEPTSVQQHTEKVKIGELVPAENVASPDEAILAVADALNTTPVAHTVTRLQAWLAQQNDTHQLWQHIAHGRRIEDGRMGRGVANDYSGVINDASLQQLVAQALGEQHYWSASQFNELGKCGYYFFAHRLLQLREQEEPSDGLDARIFGTIVHAILEGVYLPDTIIHPDNLGMVLARFHEAYEHVTHHAPEWYHFKPSSLWQIEKKTVFRQIDKLIRVDFSADSPFNKVLSGERRVWQTEYDFTQGRAVKVPIGELGELVLGGRIDRIDAVGNQLIVVDYKSGSTKINTEEMYEGRNFQMMVYILALQHLLNPDEWQVAGGFFWHTPNASASGVFKFSPNDEMALQEAQNKLSRYIKLSRQAIFPVRASQPETPSQCTRYCPYYQLCRLGVTYPKGVPHANTE